MKRMNFFHVAVAASVLAVLSGCASPDRLVKANYTQIQQNSSTQADVETLIGKPSSKLADMWIYQRPDDHLTVMIDFDAQGRVTRKQWVDGIDGAWDDTRETRKP
jgi:hypothetical protein